ncbi:MAG: stage III sporulation protein AE [Tyzzerella sp.]|nr:stage III sporulation protein AE [Tyzzerella sp.]
MRKLKILLAIGYLFFTIMVQMTEVEAAETQANEVQSEESQEELQTEWMEQFDFSEIEDMMKEIFPDEKLNFKDTVIGLISGEVEFSLNLILDMISDQISYEMRASRSGIIHILLIVIVAALFANFSGMFKSTQVAEISFSMLYMLLITICLNNFRILVTSASENIEQLTGFMEVLGPVYFLAVALATGSATSVSFYHIVLILIYIIELLILSFLLPITQIYMVIRILSELSTEIHLSKFAELLETIVSWSLKTLLAGVVGLNVIQGLLSPAIDSVKRSVLTRGGESIPLIGDAIGGVTEVVLGTAVLIKNGIGVAGMVVCLVICLTPIVQMAVTALMYQLITALIQPISDKRMVNCVGSMADGSKMLLKIILTTSVLFLLTIAVVASTSGG